MLDAARGYAEIRIKVPDIANDFRERLGSTRVMKNGQVVGLVCFNRSVTPYVA